MAVTQCVKPLQPPDAWIEYMQAALFFHIGLRVAGQRGDDLDALGSQEFGGVCLAGPEQHGKVAAIDYLFAQCPCLANQRAEVRIKLRGTAGDVYRVYLRCLGQ